MRPRAVRAIVGVTALALVLFGLPLAVAAHRVYRDEELTRLQRVATATTQGVGDQIGGGDPVELPRADGATLGLYASSGRRVGGAGPRVADARVRLALGGRVAQSSSDGLLVVAVPVARKERVIGVVRAQRSTSVVDRRDRRAWWTMGAIAAGVLAAAWGLAALLARRLARPIEQLTAAVRRLGDGDFTTSAPASAVPEVNAAGLALNATAHRLGDLVERERRFSADASHQLRTPLTALRLDLESAGEGGATRATLDAALRHVDRLEDTIATLLAAARDAQPAAERLPVLPLLEEVDRTWRGPLAAAGRRLEITPEPDLPDAAASPGATRQILQVLMDNAVRHGHGRVTVGARRSGPALAIDVSDEGPGVAGDAETIFARRSTPDAGHGIGLSLARALAAADGGRLVLQRPGPQPTFTLLLAEHPMTAAAVGA